MVWKCLSCTYENIDARTICEMCQQKKPDNPPENKLKKELVELGFHPQSVDTALLLTNDREKAITWLVNNPYKNKTNSESVSPQKPQSKPKEQNKIPKQQVKQNVKQNKKNLGEHKAPERVERLGGNIESDTANMLIQKARNEEKLRLQREKMNKRRLKEDNDVEMKDIQYMKDMRMKMNKKVKKDKEKERLERIIKTREKEKIAEKQKRDRILKKVNKTYKFDNNFNAVVKAMIDTYDEKTVILVLSKISKLLNKIWKNPKEPTFRSLNVGSKLFNNTFLRYDYSISLLRLVKFEYAEQESKDSEELGRFVIDAKYHGDIPNILSLLKNTITKLKPKFEQLEKIFSEEKQLLNSDLFGGFEYMIKILTNILVNPSSAIVRSINTESEEFKVLIKPYGQFRKLLSSYLQFKPDENEQFKLTISRKLAESESQKQKFQTCLTYFKKKSEILAKRSKIYKNVQLVSDKNSKKSVKRVLKLCEGALTNIVKDSHNVRFHRIKLSALLGSKFAGGLDLMTSLGFNINKMKVQGKTLAFAQIEYPFTKLSPVNFQVNLTLLKISISSLNL